MPSAAGVKTNSAPKARINLRRSFDTDSGMVKIDLYPLAAATMATAMPVLPEVASTIVPPGFNAPLDSAASIIAIPKRSLIEDVGL